MDLFLLADYSKTLVVEVSEWNLPGWLSAVVNFNSINDKIIEWTLS